MGESEPFFCFGRYIAGFALVAVLYPLIVFGLKPLFDEMVSPTLAVVIPLTLLWVLALALLVMIVHVKGVLLTSIGLKRTGWKTIASAVAMNVALMMLVPVLSVIAAALIPATDGGQTLDNPANSASRGDAFQYSHRCRC